MAEALFTPYINQLPPQVGSQYEEDEVFLLAGSLHDVAAEGWHFLDFHSFVKDRVVFSTPDSAVVAYSDTPSHHEYTIDMIFLRGPSAKKKALHISGASPEATSDIVSSLLELFVTSHKDEECLEVIFKCFATNPRKPFGGLNLSFVPEALENSQCKLSLSFQFMTISSTHCREMFSCQGVHCVEFRQCTVECLSEVLCECKPGLGPEKLKISCTQQEFANFSEGIRDNCSLQELDLLLHFIFSQEDAKRLTSCVQGNQHLEKLTLEYLDMDDDCWNSLCEALESHPKLKVITLAFTDKFADAARRLTPERRHERTKAVLKLVQACKTLQETNWPEFQQDQELVPAIEQCLEANKS